MCSNTSSLPFFRYWLWLLISTSRTRQTGWYKPINLKASPKLMEIHFPTVILFFITVLEICLINKIKSESESHSVLSNSLLPHGLYRPWNSPGQNTGVGSLSLLREIFPTQGLNPGLLHCRRILYQLSHKGSPRILDWVASPFSNGSSRPRNRTGDLCIADGFFTNWAPREGLSLKSGKQIT